MPYPKLRQQTLDAVFEGGVFRPLKRPEMPEGQRVRLVVQTATETTPDDLLTLAAQVYEGLSEREIDEIERIALDRSSFFVDRSQ